MENHKSIRAKGFVNSSELMQLLEALNLQKGFLRELESYKREKSEPLPMNLDVHRRVVRAAMRMVRDHIAEEIKKEPERGSDDGRS